MYVTLRRVGLRPMKTRVLVVDDDRMVADTLCMLYQASGFESEARYSAAAGFERAKSFAPALVLCDVTMPEESGLQLATRVQQALPGTRLLMLTGHASNAAVVRAYGQQSQQPLRLLSKPCRPDDLLRESRALLSG